MKTPQKRKWDREASITCSHIWHNDIPKCIYWSDTQSVKVWLHFRHECSSIMYENTQKYAIKSKGFPKIAIISGISIHQNVSID